MRIGTFLLGGIAGAAAVIYLNRNAKSMMFSAFNSSSSSADTPWKGSIPHQAGNEIHSKAEQSSAGLH